MHGIIDIHTHPHWDQPLERMTHMLEVAGRVGIERLVVLGGNGGFGFRPTQDQVRQINDLTIALVRRWPERLIAFCRLSAAHGRAFLEREIDRCFATGLFKGIKLALWPKATSARLDPIMHKAREHEAVVLHHCWYKTVNYYEGESDPTDIADLAGRFPDVPIIMPHLSGCGQRGVLDVEPLPNVYVDTSGSQAFAGMVEYGVDVLGADRLLFGSDVFGRDFAVQLGRIHAARISATDKRKILRDNAVRLLRL